MPKSRLLPLACLFAALLAGLASYSFAQELSSPASDDNSVGLTKVSKQAPQDGQETPEAEKGGQPATPGDGSGEQPRPGLFGKPNMVFLVMIGGFVLLYIWMGRGRRKQEAKRKEMLANLRKGEKVTSIGGIVGTIMEVREDEVTVKVDENNNIRMKLARWAIRGVGEESKTERPDEHK